MVVSKVTISIKLFGVTMLFLQVKIRELVLIQQIQQVFSLKMRMKEGDTGPAMA